jgi:IS30 family transposase
MNKYQYLNVFIFLITLEKHYPKEKIAKILGVDRSTIYRELKRNSCSHCHGRKNFKPIQRMLNSA